MKKVKIILKKIIIINILKKIKNTYIKILIKKKIIIICIKK